MSVLERPTDEEVCPFDWVLLREICCALLKERVWKMCVQDRFV